MLSSERFECRPIPDWSTRPQNMASPSKKPERTEPPSGKGTAGRQSEIACMFGRLWLLLVLTQPGLCEPSPLSTRLGVADRFLAGHKWVEALGIYKGILAEQPACKEALYGSGWVYNQQGKFDLSVPLLTQASGSWPEDFRIWNELGYAFYRLGNVEKAGEAYTRAAELDPSFQSYRFLGDVLYDFKRETPLILAAYQKALDRGCRDPLVYYRMGWCLNERGEFLQAVVQLRLSLQGAPKMSASWLELGYALLRSGQIEEAVPALRKAVSLEPGLRLAHLYLGRAHLLQKDLTGAEKEVNSLRNLDPELSRQLQNELNQSKLP